MTTLTRRNILTGLAATALASAIPAEPQSTLSPADRKDAAAKLIAYFTTTAPQLLRPAEGIMQHPSIAPSLPGKEYSASLWDWDTLWTSTALYRFAKINADPAFHAKLNDHVQGSLLNFLDHQGSDGRLPIMMSGKSADPFKCLAPGPTPNPRNQAKPVFSQLALLAANEASSTDWLAPHFDKLLNFYSSWTTNNQTPTGLFVWGDDVAIGDDNDPTTFGRPDFSSANLLLNTLFYADLNAAAELAKRLNRASDQNNLSAQAGVLGAAILKHGWDSRDRFFYTVDVQCVDQRMKVYGHAQGMKMSWNCLPLKVQLFTGFLPLWCNLATPEQATQLIRANYLADDRLRANYGVRSLSNLEPMYAMDFSSNPSNWLGPVWIIVNYFAWKALSNYGFSAAANDLADKTIALLAKDLDTNAALNEYYHPDTGAALSHKGFMDWNMLVLEMI
jgi:putative isomerase